ncbi:MAG: 3-hydroxyacyl-CoA dehydrogenase family protein [Myxococcota bacterium]
MKVSVLGAGTMGHGIAQVCAQAGYEVRLHDVDEAALARALERIHASLGKLAAKGRVAPDSVGAIGARIRRTTDDRDALEGADVVIEAAPERLELKLELFRAIDRHAPEHALLATNTSSISITEIAGITARPEQVVGLHFFNPVPVMDLVEIIRGLRTGDGALQRARTFVQALGKEAVVVRDWPGFATSRLGVALGAEAIRMLEQGVASAEDIDRAMELGYRHPMGPLKLTDLVGLDVRLAILEHLHRELGEQFRPPALLRQLVRAGKLGRKTGEGFYTYG